jgi:hypothetical protein
MPIEYKTSRDIRLDLVRGLALLIICSDHIYTNPLRTLTPIGLGFSDMAEMFIFLSGYLNGIATSEPTSVSAFALQIGKAMRRSLVLFAAIILVHLVTVLMVAAAAALNAKELSSIAGLTTMANGSQPDMWTILTLKHMPANVCVLALYLLLLPLAPCIAYALRRYLIETVAVSWQIYALVQIYPETLALPYPWTNSFFFNPFAWQLPFVMGMSCGVRPKECKRYIPRSVLALASAVVAMSVTGLLFIYGDPPRSQAVWKHTLGPLRLIHFYCILIVGRMVLRRDRSFLTWPLFRPVTVCGQHPLLVYCAGAVWAVIGQFFFSKYGITLLATITINVIGWTLSILIARVASKPG